MTSPQQPIASRFNAHSSASEVMSGVDLSGKIAIVTGGYSGLGLATSAALATAGATVVVPALTVEKARAALSALNGVQQEVVDLSDPRSIDAFAERFLSSHRALDILIHSAGIMAPPLGRDARGRESQFAINHLGHFRLAARLAPALRDAASGRVISMSSRAHRLSAVDFDDPNFERKDYNPWQAYGQSKTANALFAVELDRRERAYGVRAYSVHPGSILTDLARHLSREQIAGFGAFEEDGSVRIDPDRDLKTVEQGAATALWCATSTDLGDLGGVYCENCNVAVERSMDDQQPDGVRSWAADPEMAERLWLLSEQAEGMSGIR